MAQYPLDMAKLNIEYSGWGRVQRFVWQIPPSALATLLYESSFTIQKEAEREMLCLNLSEVC